MALNDPQWGNRRGPQGPPDLDELWRKFNEKLNALFGGKPGGGRPSGAGGNHIPGGAWLLVVLIFLVWVASGFYIINPSQRGVELRFGKYSVTTQPGPHWHWPYPIESYESVNFDQVRQLEVGYRGDVGDKRLKESLMLTDDLDIIDIQFAVQYDVKEAYDYLFKNRVPDDTVIVMQAAETAMREVVGRSKLDFVLKEGRERVTDETKEIMQAILDRYHTGIRINKVTLRGAQAPAEVKAAFDDVVKADQDRERKRNEGQAYFNQVVPSAQGTASRLVLEAEGYKQRVIADAQGDASRFRQILVEYQKAPVVTRDRLYLDMMQQVLANTSKVLVDQKSSNNLLYLPLDKLLQMSPGSASPEPDGAPQKSVQDYAPPPADTSTLRSRDRDALRSREREVR